MNQLTTRTMDALADAVHSRRYVILFLTSAGPQGNGEGSDFLVKFLRGNLQAGTKILIPDMPDLEAPHYKPWKKKLERTLRDHGNEKVILIGHSIGASVALKYLSEKPPMKSIAGLFLIGAVYWGLKNWEVNEYSYEHGFQRHLQYIPNIFFYHSKDDEVVPVSHLWHFAVALPHAKIRQFDHEGHLYVNGIPSLVEDINSIDE
ncbi:alpha/beta hydrolase [Chryseolinea sp. T2]|uniref:alpha/beta fold hydrolase n=1 Tax=Chryseolinea sp. T2 TaxID=3129255 RepID=UPI0030769AED